MMGISTDTLIKSAATIIYENQGQFSYRFIHLLLNNKLDSDYLTKVAQLLALSTVVYKIPFFEDNICKFRAFNECFQDAITFYNSNKAEVEIIEASECGCVSWMDEVVLPELHYSDNTHQCLQSGAGGDKPDLADNDGNTYEVKRNYFTAGSRSSLHDANFLINCSNHVIELFDRSLPNWEIQIPVRFKQVLSPKYVFPDWLTAEAAWYLSSGTLIPEVLKVLEHEYIDFQWRE